MNKILNWCKKHKVWTGVIVLVLLVGFIGALGDTGEQTKSQDADKSTKNETATNTKTDEKVTPQEVKGTYTDPNGKQYQYFINEKDGKQVALFQPVLPRDDGVVVSAMLEVAAKTYGADAKIDPTPQPVEKNGQNLISFKGDGVTYYFLLVKEDTGEVNSLTYWKE